MNKNLECMLDLMHRVPVLLTEQLEEYVRRVQSLKRDEVHRMVVSAGKVGKLVLSKNGYVTTKEYLSLIQEGVDTWEFNEHSWERLDELHPKQRFLDEIECFWVVLNSWKQSGDFHVGTDPYQIQYVTEDGKKFVQIVRITASNELTVPLQLRNMPWPSASWQDRINRIAIVDSPQAANLIPHIGFSHICVMDENAPDNVRIVQTRIGEAVWVESDSLC